MEEQENTTEITVVEPNKRGPYKKTKPKTTFLKPKGHDLDKAIKHTGRYLQTALETLVHISVDKTAETKDRRMAAEAILTIHQKMVDQRDKDEIARLQNEIDRLGLVGQGSTVEDEEEDDDTPVLEFDTIDPIFVDVETSEVEEKVDKEEG